MIRIIGEKENTYYFFIPLNKKIPRVNGVADVEDLLKNKSHVHKYKRNEDITINSKDRSRLTKFLGLKTSVRKNKVESLLKKSVEDFENKRSQMDSMSVFEYADSMVKNTASSIIENMRIITTPGSVSRTVIDLFGDIRDGDDYGTLKVIKSFFKIDTECLDKCGLEYHIRGKKKQLPISASGVREILFHDYRKILPTFGIKLAFEEFEEEINSVRSHILQETNNLFGNADFIRLRSEACVQHFLDQVKTASVELYSNVPGNLPFSEVESMIAKEIRKVALKSIWR